MKHQYVENLKTTITFWKVIEEYAEYTGIEDMTVTSMLRTKHRNEVVGGSRNSQHLYGKAVDIATRHTYALAKIIEELIRRGRIPEGGIGIYDHHVHYDWRGEKARWNKTTSA